VLRSRIEEANLWKSRCNELENSLCHVNTELEIANMKQRNLLIMEGKMDEVMKENVLLSGEKDLLNK
jgi:hypothetical protein